MQHPKYIWSITPCFGYFALLVFCNSLPDTDGENNFADGFGNEVLSKIIQGAAVKAASETFNRIEFSQEASCLTCNKAKEPCAPGFVQTIAGNCIGNPITNCTTRKVDGCPCRLTGEHCLDNLICNSSELCGCPLGDQFVRMTNGSCINSNRITLTLPANGVNGILTCIPNPNKMTAIPGVLVKFINPSRLPELCRAVVTAVTTPPKNIPQYTNPTLNPGVLDTYIRVDPVTGQISYTSDQSVPPTAGGAAMLCGPSAANVFGGQVTVDPITLQFTPAVSEPLIQTYVIQCIDANGVASNAVTLPITFPSCDVSANVCP